MTGGNPADICVEPSIEAVALPLVSVVIVNYNYARFLPQAVASVFSQSYPAIDCLVVDDASTDDSRDVIADLARRYTRMRVLYEPRNVGALRASLDGIAATVGPFVHLLDADDLVLPEFLATHVAAHLSLRDAVGFTCSDMIVSHEGAAVSCCDHNIARYRRDPRCAPAERRAPPAHLAGLGLPADLLRVETDYPTWPWTATSAIVYRRTALDLVSGIEGVERITNATDTVFCQAINTIAGSVIIDAPLAVYRAHSKNDHLTGLPLNHLMPFDKRKVREKQVATIDVLIAHVIARRRELAARCWDPAMLLEVLHRLCCLHPDEPASWRLIQTHETLLAEVVDRRVLRRWIRAERWIGRRRPLVNHWDSVRIKP